MKDGSEIGGAGTYRDTTTVFYDGACPICRAEIGVMARCDRKRRLAFSDVSDPEAVLPANLERARVLERFHVTTADGRILDGPDAFAAMWREVPLFRPLARLASLPGATVVLERLYRGFLRVRPRLQPLFAWLERR